MAPENALPWAAHFVYNSCLPKQTKGYAMSSKKPKATRKRMISCFAQIVQEHIPGWKIEEIASGEKVKARKFSYSSQVYLLMLSQFLHLFSLNEIVDVSKIYAAELSRVRGITPANLNTLFKALKQALQLQDFYGENENAVEECARTKGVGSGERSELRSSLKAPRDGDPALLWDSTTPRLRRHRIGNAVFAGFREDVPEVCGIAERRFAGRWRRESSHATENGIS